jgi:hypothetical protein
VSQVIASIPIGAKASAGVGFTIPLQKALAHTLDYLPNTLKCTFIHFHEGNSANDNPA